MFEIRVDGLSKSFGKQLIFGDVTLTVPAGEICEPQTNLNRVVFTMVKSGDHWLVDNITAL